MKKKVFLGLVVILIILIVIIIGFGLKNYSSEKASDNIKIIQYKEGTNDKLKEININKASDKKELSNYVKKLKPLTADEMVELALAQEIQIQYNDYITIGIQLDEKSYCYYINKKENISSLSKMSKGLYEWVEEKIQ